ncbi:hypothetical protein RD792_001188 [Penstemon davidsonii]|uniref:WAT1-related protein n=1 Tax=Penstemon davidsonii TaxID=160366 RepID=A0ABR0DNX9_9LAMI|nr:hypothetical protein RD792_001188 [Penstemon davidsonii]
MILSQVASGGVSMFYKVAVADGMRIDILIAYRYIFAAIFIAPLALIIERRSRPKFTWMIAIQGFACGIFGASLGSNLYAESMVLTSATFATAMTNVIPALTLIMAVVFRLERLDIRTSLSGKAKVVGTALGISGAMVLTFYKGINITIWSTHINLLRGFEANSGTKGHNHFKGSILAFCSCLSYTAWLIIQTRMSRMYPLYSSTAIVCSTGAILSGIYALCKETHLTEWKLGWNIRLMAAAYTGIVGSGIAIAITAWGTRMKGPLYVSSFTPLALIFVAVLGSLILDEMLNLGSVIGSVLIILGLYIVLWGKSKEIITSRNQTGGNNSMVADSGREETSSEATEKV